MFQKIFGVLLIAVLAGCANTAPDARSVVIASESTTSMVDFRDVREYPGHVTCGSYQVTSRWGESSGFSNFIVVGDKLKQQPNQQDTVVFCNDNPREAFEEEFGIMPADKSNPGLTKFRRDFTTLEAALTAYKADTKYFPSPEEGLKILVLGANDTPTGKYRPGGYLKEIPLDYWGRNYIYEPSRWGGIKQYYTIETLGADGERGGKGTDADISSKLIPFLLYLDSL